MEKRKFNIHELSKARVLVENEMNILYQRTETPLARRDYTVVFGDDDTEEPVVLSGNCANLVTSPCIVFDAIWRNGNITIQQNRFMNTEQ
jgi:hypothetical protein